MTSAEELLTDVQTLRRRARRDRRASAFPLLLFGVLILAAPLCYVPMEPVELDFTSGVWYMDQIPEGPFPAFFGIGPFVAVKYPGLIGWYWFLVIVVGFVATAWWYRRRALRIGVETDTRAYLVSAGAALAGFLLGVPLLKELVPARNTLYSTPSTNLPILFGSAAVAAVVLFWATRRDRADILRAAGLLLGLLLATVAFAALGVYLIYGFSALLIVAAGLLVLAWLERSVLLGGIGVVFGAAALLANLYDIENLFYLLGWIPDQPQPLVLQQLLLPALVLLAGSAIVALSGRSAR
ncbi:MAG TPA: hypothetical protein VGR06_34665 [Actinophytocola sp.]|jgi:hypothetical protein|uniref:hypothetical protein n=1 Tax=Actinophytocola sp. TaxID=1872138 RepID=UPI002DFB8D94|nr:hypothetical protein [Actinophytocola sp.]